MMIARVTFLFFVAVTALSLGSAGSAHAQDRSDEILGSFRDWTAYRITRGDEVFCFATSGPKQSSPKNVKRSRIAFMVTIWPARSIAGEPSIEIGYPFRKSSKPTVTIKNRQFEMFVDNETAWLSDHSQEKALIDEMKDNVTMVVKGISQRGTKTTDNFSLLGFSNALTKAEAACK